MMTQLSHLQIQILAYSINSQTTIVDYSPEQCFWLNAWVGDSKPKISKADFNFLLNNQYLVRAQVTSSFPQYLSSPKAIQEMTAILAIKDTLKI